MTELTIEIGLLGDKTDKGRLCAELLEVLKGNDIIHGVKDDIRSSPELDSYQFTTLDGRQVRAHFNYFHGRSEDMNETFEKMDAFIVVWPVGPKGMLYHDTNFGELYGIVQKRNPFAERFIAGWLGIGLDLINDKIRPDIRRKVCDNAENQGHEMKKKFEADKNIVVNDPIISRVHDGWEIGDDSTVAKNKIERLFLNVGRRAVWAMQERIHLKDKVHPDDFWDHIKSSSSPKAPSGQAGRQSRTAGSKRKTVQVSVDDEDGEDDIETKKRSKSTSKTGATVKSSKRAASAQVRRSARSRK